MSKTELRWDQYSLTVKQVSTFCAFPAVKNVEKHSVCQCLCKTGPKLGPMLVPPRAELCFLSLAALGGVTPQRVGGIYAPFGGRGRASSLSLLQSVRSTGKLARGTFAEGSRPISVWQKTSTKMAGRAQ